MKYTGNILTHWQYINILSHINTFSPVLILVCLVQRLFYVGNTVFPCRRNLLPIQRLKQIFWQNIIKMLMMNNLRASLQYFLFISHLLSYVPSVYIWTKCSSLVSHQWQHRNYLWYLLCKKFFCICDISFVLYN